MKKFNYAKKLTISATIAAILSSIGAGSVFAWGPERTTYTMEHPASQAVFNSITDNPVIGDEREFVRIGVLRSVESLDDANAKTEMKSSIVIEPGKQYLVSIYYHNDAGSNKNSEDSESCHHCGIATNTRVATNFPKVLTPGTEGKVGATISWNVGSDTTKQEVWDDVTLTTSTKKVLLKYVTDSAEIYNDVLKGAKLSSSLFEETGTFIGYDILDGLVPGCEQYHGRVFYVLEAEELSGTIDKTVSIDGTNFSEQVEINPGEEVTFKLDVKNTGDRELTNVVVKDVLPAGLELVPGTVRIWANESTTEDTISDDIVKNGVNIGTVGTGNTVHITFRAKAGDDFDCEGTNMQNTATITYDSDVATGDTAEDTASVIVKKDGCEPTPTPTPEPTPTPDVLPNTGPVEITMAIIIIVGIAGGCFYLYRTRKSLKTIENTAAGKDTMAEKDASEKDSSQNPDNMVK